MAVMLRPQQQQLLPSSSPPPPPPPSHPRRLLSGTCCCSRFSSASNRLLRFPNPYLRLRSCLSAIPPSPFHTLGPLLPAPLEPPSSAYGSSNGNNNNNNGNNNNNNGWGWWSWNPFQPDDIGAEAGSDAAWAALVFLVSLLSGFFIIPLAIATVVGPSAFIWEVRGGKWTRLVPDSSGSSFVVDCHRGGEGGGRTPLSLSGLESCWRQCRDIFLRLMLPEGYPNSVSTDYLEYSLWRGLQGVASQISGVLSTQAKKEMEREQKEKRKKERKEKERHGEKEKGETGYRKAEIEGEYGTESHGLKENRKREKDRERKHRKHHHSKGDAASSEKDVKKESKKSYGHSSDRKKSRKHGNGTESENESRHKRHKKDRTLSQKSSDHEELEDGELGEDGDVC